MKKQLTTKILVLALIASCQAIASPLLGKAERPNIIIIFTDDLDFDDIGNGVYDTATSPSYTGLWLQGFFEPLPTPDDWHPQHYASPRKLTPNLDALAADGATLERFYITSPMCTPSRYSLLTGQYAGRSQSVMEQTPAGEPPWVAWNSYIREDSPSIARAMQAQGYHTAFIGKWHNGGPSELSPKYWYRELADDPEALAQKLPEVQRAAQEYIARVTGFDTVDRVSMGNLDNYGGNNLPWYTEGALDYIDQRHDADQPFFLYMPVPVPHGSAPGDDYGPDLHASPIGRLEQAPDVQPGFERIKQRLDERGLSHRGILATWLDDSLGAILNRLEQHGIADDTLVIFTSDHQSRGKGTVYEGARVPCIVRWPNGIPAGIRVREICANIDLLPTLVDLAGGAIPASSDGISFLANLRGQEPQHPNRALLLETGYTRAVVQGHWKYITSQPPNVEQVLAELERDRVLAAKEGIHRRVNWKGTPREQVPVRDGGIFLWAISSFPNYYDQYQLYDLQRDPFERFNLIGQPAYRPRADALHEEMQAIIATLPYSF